MCSTPECRIRKGYTNAESPAIPRNSWKSHSSSSVEPPLTSTMAISKAFGTCLHQTAARGDGRVEMEGPQRSKKQWGYHED